MEHTNFHQHLSNFINSHLPELPDTMQLMDQISYDFNANGNGNNTNTNDINMEDNNNNLPTLQREEENTNGNGNNKNKNKINSMTIDELRRQLNALNIKCENQRKQFEECNTELLNYKAKCSELSISNRKLRLKLSSMENQLIGTRNVLYLVMVSYLLRKVKVCLK